MRWARRVLVILLVLAAGLTLLTVAVRQYLASQQALALVTSYLAAAYGGPVQVAKIRVGLHNSSVSNLQFYEPQAEPKAKPWAVIPEAEGKVIVEDEVVQLRDVHGRAAGGEIWTNGDLNFRDTPSQLQFAVEARGLELARVPKSWSLPPQLKGRLTGQAHLQVTLVDGKPRTQGEGRGVIDEAWVAGVPAQPIHLVLHAAGEGFRFLPQEPAANRAPEAALPALALATVALQAPPAVGPPRSELFFPAQVASWVQGGVLRAIRAVTDTASHLVARLSKAENSQARKADRPAPKQEPSYLEASLNLEDVDLEQLIQGLGVRLPFAVAGRISVQVQAAFPLDTAGDLQTYRFRGTATLPWITLAGLGLEQVQARVHYAEGILRLEELRGRIPIPPPPGAVAPPPGIFQGTARLQVVPQGEVAGHLELHSGDLSVLERLAPEFRPPVPLTGRFEVTANLHGNLKPLTLRASGTGSAANLRVSAVRISALKFDWESDANRLRVLNLATALYGGELAGMLVIPFRATVPGSAELHFQDLDVGILSKEVPAMPFRLQGRASGKVIALLPAATPGREREVTAETDLQAPRLRVQGIPTERLRGTVRYRQGIAEYHFDGETLGGRFRLDGEVPPSKRQPIEPAFEGRLRIEGAELSRLGEVLKVRAGRIPLQGILDLDLPFRHEEPDGAPVGTGRFSITRLRWDRTELAGSIRGEVNLTRRELRLRDLTGVLGQGLVRGQVAINFQQPDRSWFTLDFTRVEASRLLAPWPDLASLIEGPLQARLRGILGREWFGSGLVVLARGTVLGVDISAWRLPLDWSFAPGQGRGQVQIRESSAQVARGRATAQANLGWGAGSRLDGSIRFFGVDLQTLLRQLTESSQIGAGQMTGRFEFAGSEVRSLNDLTGILEAAFAQTQALEFPVLRQLAPYLAPGQSPNAFFRSGDLRARLARGVFRIERLSLVGTLVQLFMEGTISLQGRLALDVLANTGRLGPNPVGLRLLGLRLPVTGPVPLGLLTQASNYLSNRLLHLRVSGTIRSPIVQIEPISLLTEEAVRFFVSRSNLPIP